MDIFSDKSNRLVFGVSGSGKATYTKDEMYQILTKTLRDKIVVVDIDYEYVSFAEKFGGDVITLRLDEKMYFNICDLVIDWEDTEGCLKRKILLLTSAIEDLLPHPVWEQKDCSPEFAEAIERCCRKMYQPYIQAMSDVRTVNEKDIPERYSYHAKECPTLKNLYDELIRDETSAAHSIASAIEPYAVREGSLFSHHTNVFFGFGRFTVFYLNELPEKMKPFAAKVCYSYIINEIILNHTDNVTSWVYLDVFHLYINSENAAQGIYQDFAHMKEYNSIFTGIEMDVSDILCSASGQKLFDSMGRITVFRQTNKDFKTLSEKWGLSREDKDWTEVGIGKCILKYYGTVHCFAFEPDPVVLSIPRRG